MNETLEKIKEYLERIKVMTAWLAGKRILVRYEGDLRTYELIDSPSWDWSKVRYFVVNEVRS